MSDLLLGKKLQNATSLAASFASDPIPVRTVCLVGIIVETAGITANQGEFTVEVRIKKNQNEYSGWASLSGVSITLADDDINPTFLLLQELPPCEVRVVYDQGAGTPDGNTTVWYSLGGVK